MASKTGVVTKGGSVSQTLKNAGFDSSVYNSKSAWDTVAKANGLDSNYTVQAGQKLNFAPLLGSTPAITKAATPVNPATTAARLPSPVAPTTEVGSSTSTVATRTPLPIDPNAAQSPTAPTNPQEMKDYLNGYQNNLNASQIYDPLSGAVSGQAVDKFATDKLGVDPNALPEAPKYTEMFMELRKNYGIDNIETGISEYKNLIRNEELMLKEQTTGAKAGVTRQGVIEGRVDKATQDRQSQIQWYQNNVSFLTDQANSAYSFINTVMSLTEKDYNTSKQAYQDDFNNRLGIYNVISNEAKDTRNFNYQLQQDQQKLASTNLSMYMDLITKGSLKYDSISKTDQAQIHKMEVQAGLGVGFLSQVKAPAGSEVKQIIQRTDPNTGISYADVIGIGSDGSLQKLRSVKLGAADLSLAQQKSLKTSSGGGGSSSSSTKNSYGYTPSQWNTKLSSARTDLMKWEDASNVAGTGDHGDYVLAKGEVAKIEQQFKAKYGDAGHELMVNALNQGGYTLYNEANGGKLKVKWS